MDRKWKPEGLELSRGELSAASETKKGKEARKKGASRVWIYLTLMRIKLQGPLHDGDHSKSLIGTLIICSHSHILL